MFVGHYAPALALKAVRKSPSLAAGFLAVQLVDIGFFSLSYFGIEKWRPNGAIQGFMPVDLYFMPYTHSLIGAAGWALAAGMATAVLTPKGGKLIGSLIIAALVLSHWGLDLIVHRHDLGILGDAEQKLGYGLWDQPLIEMPLELGLLLAGFAVYLAVTRARGAVGNIAPWIVLTALFVAQGINWFAPPAADPAIFSAMGLAAYFAMAGLAFWLDRVRT